MRRNRDFGIKQNNGPLMTDHLRDLDIELELLKRKREILQQEQNMISRLSRQNNYELPSSSFRHEPNQYQPQQVDLSNFSNLYDSQGGSRNFRQTLKRQHQSNWQANPPKRFNAPRALNPWQDELVQSQRKPIQPPKRFSPVPRMSAKPGISQRLKRENPNPRRDFQPTKVIKPNQKGKSKNGQSKNRPQPKIVNYPVNEAKSLVSGTMKALEPRKDQILQADREPSLQMKGRMELALGSILKEIRQELSNDTDVSEYFATHYIQRIIKRTIRSRIRDVMMGKAIGTINDILENYRNTYPKETDIEIMRTVKDAQAYSSKNLCVTHLIESEDPQEFFKKNMMSVLSKKLDDLFSNLQKFYENKDKQIIDSINKLPEPKPTENPKQTDEYNEKVNLQQILNNFFESVPEDSDLVKALGGRIDKAKHYIDFMDRLIEERLPKVLPKFKDVMINILYHDREFIGAKAMIMSEMKKKAKAKDESLTQRMNEEVNKVADKAEEIADVIIRDDKEEKNDVKTVEDTKEGIEDNDEKIEEVKNIEDKVEKIEEVKSIEDKVEKIEEVKSIEDKVEKIEEVKSIEDKVEKIEEVKSIEDKVEKIEEVKSIEDKTEKMEEVKSTGIIKNVTPTDKTTASVENEVLYYIKFVGRPKLPARSLIYDFLNKFNTKSIKKHKTIHNLLVLTFTNKDDYDRILAANETVIGDSTIIIKASEQITTSKEASQNTPEKRVEDKSSSEKLDDSLSTDLGNKKSDLLSSKGKTGEDISPTCNIVIENMSSGIAESNGKVEVGDDKLQSNDKVAETDDKLQINDKDTEPDDKAGGNNMAESNIKVEEMEVTESIDQITDNSKITDKILETLEVMFETHHEKDNSENEEDVQLEAKSTEQLEKDKKDLVENKTDTQNKDNANEIEIEKLNKIEALKVKESGRSTPTRFSSRLANTSCSVTTRRASRLAQNK